MNPLIAVNIPFNFWNSFFEVGALTQTTTSHFSGFTSFPRLVR